MLAWINNLLILAIAGAVAGTVMVVKLAVGLAFGVFAILSGITVTFFMMTYALFELIKEALISSRSK